MKWNTAIFKLYKNKISLNTLEIEDKINSELKKTKLNKSLLLSEIQVNLSSEGLELTTNKVLSKIEEVGFENAARDLGVSESAKNGGNIGWIKGHHHDALVFADKLQNVIGYIAWVRH